MIIFSLPQSSSLTYLFSVFPSLSLSLQQTCVLNLHFVLTFSAITSCCCGTDAVVEPVLRYIFSITIVCTALFTRTLEDSSTILSECLVLFTEQQHSFFVHTLSLSLQLYNACVCTAGTNFFLFDDVHCSSSESHILLSHLSLSLCLCISTSIAAPLSASLSLSLSLSDSISL